MLSGDAPTKKMPLHTAFFDSRSQTGAVVHLHSTYSVALSALPVQDTTNFLPPLTAYSIMRLGKVALLPYFRPGDSALGNAIRGLDSKHSAAMLANHGPIVAGKSLDAAVYAMEELEETAKLTMLLRGLPAKGLGEAQIGDIVSHFDVNWE